jgi:hypothetical protein
MYLNTFIGGNVCATAKQAQERGGGQGLGRPVKKVYILILRKNRPVQQICLSNKIDQAVQFKLLETLTEWRSQ